MSPDRVENCIRHHVTYQCNDVLDRTHRRRIYDRKARLADYDMQRSVSLRTVSQSYCARKNALRRVARSPSRSETSKSKPPVQESPT